MTRIKFGTRSMLLVTLAGLVFMSGVVWQNALAQGTLGPAEQPPAQPAALASTLSYYFISGTTFTPDQGGVFYYSQVADCVGQMPLITHMLAPIHLPQASVVVSMTLFSYDTVITTTVGRADFIVADAQSPAGTEMHVSSNPGIATYQNRTNTPFSPIIIDNQHYAYNVSWVKIPQVADADSPYLSLCGVRLAYYAPVAATFLPLTVR